MNYKKIIKKSKLFQAYKGIKYGYQLNYKIHQNITKAVLGSCSVKTIYLHNRKIEQIRNMLLRTNIKLDKHSELQFWIDEKLYFNNFDLSISNIPPNYELILNHSIMDLKKIYQNQENKIAAQNEDLLEIIEEYIARIIKQLENGDEKIYHKSLESFNNMLNRKAESLFDALQRILFWSSIFWQTQHKLVGLGRLDKLLSDFDYINDEYSLDILKSFLSKMHDNYVFKSSVLLGDIGQIIILGGLDSSGEYEVNRYTYSIINAIKDLRYPDPKVLLRTSSNMPRDLMELAVACIDTGIGSPLLSNDEIVVPLLQEFGYSEFDSYNYVTSACWEPVSYGNSLEQNNISTLNFAKAFYNTIQDERLSDDSDYLDFINLFKVHLKILCDEIQSNINNLKWERDPLYTLFTDNCIISEKDISEGGAKYNDYGILTVGLANAINSIFNIKKIIFTDKRYLLSEIKIILLQNYESYNSLQMELKNSFKYFGHDDMEIIDLVNEVLSVVKNTFNDFVNPFGGKVKFGLSSPSYIDDGRLTQATFDGRNNGDPLSTHISSSSNLPYTELISFSSNIKYSGISSNGNVIDFIVAPQFIKNNFDKFVDFLFLSIKQGFFQMQMNVVSSKTLILAKENPHDFSELIVRVWGFSAYFKDLPLEYQNILIMRAQESEANV